MASPTMSLHIVLLCGPLSVADGHRPTGLGKLGHGMHWSMKKVYSYVCFFLLLFQATYKGWLDIMNAAVDSRGVSRCLTRFQNVRLKPETLQVPRQPQTPCMTALSSQILYPVLLEAK